MRFPVKVSFRGVTVKIYGKTPAYGWYRVAGRVGGKRKVISFRTYSEARAYAERLTRDIYNGRQITFSDAELAEITGARAELQRLSNETGRSYSLLSAVVEFAEVVRMIPESTTLAEVARRYLATIACVKRISTADAIAEYLAMREAMTRSRNGERSQLSPKAAYVERKQLERVGECLGTITVCNLTPSHLEAFFSTLSDMTPKTRNHYRATISAMLDWARRRDYIAESAVKRLTEADCMRRERPGVEAIEFYTPAEFGALLSKSDGIVQVMIAIAGLAGLRIAELLRLDWADVWRVPGHIEVPALKAKTRTRRLVPICPALASWLEPYRGHKAGRLWTQTEISFQRRLVDAHEAAGVRRKRNGLRHGFVTYCFALHGETQTAQWAGHTPQQLFAHYRGLATPEQARAWFSVLPTTPSNAVSMREVL
ncbi:MAG TPA: site-specific integrase [Verrucomicrobiota bacterium]|nr:site-specific integrase [Verrucomicrobiota bacterium]